MSAPEADLPQATTEANTLNTAVRRPRTFDYGKIPFLYILPERLGFSQFSEGQSIILYQCSWYYKTTMMSETNLLERIQKSQTNLGLNLRTISATREWNAQMIKVGIMTTFERPEYGIGEGKIMRLCLRLNRGYILEVTRGHQHGWKGLGTCQFTRRSYFIWGPLCTENALTVNITVPKYMNS